MFRSFKHKKRKVSIISKDTQKPVAKQTIGSKNVLL